MENQDSKQNHQMQEENKKDVQELIDKGKTLTAEESKHHERSIALIFLCLIS